jgi:hypothetical protein
MNVLLPAVVQAYSFGGWSIGLWVGEVFEEEANAPLSRAAINLLQEGLERVGPVELQMPDFDAWDIVAEGSLAWRGHRYRLVVNTSDGVVGIEHAEREPLDDLMAVIGGDIHLAA